MGDNMAAKHYVFEVYCSFKMQYTFSEQEVQRDCGGDETDFEPTDKALEALQRELEEHLSSDYGCMDVHASADSDSLLAVEEDSLEERSDGEIDDIRR
jgi:hypothetical protein